jgi:hypothetical protein
VNRFCTERWEFDLNHGNRPGRRWEKRSRRGSLRTVFVNSRGKPGVRLAQNITIPHGKTGEIGSIKTLDLPFCLFASRPF